MSINGANGAMASLSADSPPGNLLVRTLSALVLGPLVIAVIYLGGAAFALLLAGTGFVALREWFHLVGAGGRDIVLELSFGALVAALVVVLAAGVVDALVVLAALAAALAAVVSGAGYANRGLVALGLPYIGLPVAVLLWLRGQPEAGFGIVLWLFLIVWATDIGGYAAGRTIGGPKLAPVISPKKTWAGLAGAVAAAALIGGIAAAVLGAASPLWAAALAAALAVVAQMGDLAESAVKRRFHAKDSGALIPGHGGILDRIDGLLAAAPMLALFHATLGGVIGWW